MIEGKERYNTAVHALENYGDDIYRLSFVYMKNKEDSEDIVQETLMKLLQTNCDFENEQHLKAWLLRIAINLCKNRLKSSYKKEIQLDDTILESNSYSIEEPDEILDAILNLDEQYRTVIHLFYYEQYSTKEISLLLNKKEGTVRSLLSRGRKKLKEIIQTDINL